MLDLARPVQRGRLSEFSRDRLEISPCEGSCSHVERARKEDRPDRIDHVQVVDQDERGDHPPPKNIVITKITLKKFRPTNSFLDIGYAASSVTNTEITVNPAE